MLNLRNITMIALVTLFAFAGGQGLLMAQHEGHDHASGGQMQHAQHNHDTEGMMGGGMMKHMGGMMGHMRGMMCGMHGMMMQQMGGMMQMNNLLGYRDELNLSSDQIASLKELLVEMSDKTGDIQGELQTAELELSNMLDSKDWDMGEIEDQVREVESLRADLRITVLKHRDKAMDVLNADQRRKLAELDLGHHGSMMGMMTGSGHHRGGSGHHGGMMGGSENK